MVFIKLNQAIKVVQKEMQQGTAAVVLNIKLLPATGYGRVIQLVDSVDITTYFIEDVCRRSPIFRCTIEVDPIHTILSVLQANTQH